MKTLQFVLLSVLVLVAPRVSAQFSGTLSACPGFTSSLTDSLPGGLWTSSNSGIASVGSLSGVVTGISSGTCTISHTASGITRTEVFTVYAGVGAIGGSSTVCTGSSVTLTETSTGGSWNSSVPGTATVSSGGVVTGVNAGVVTITYFGSSGCYSTKTLTVSVTPPAITGPPVQCTGQTTQFTTSGTGGVWTSSNTSAAAITSPGYVTGVNPGPAIISYTIAGCSSILGVTVDPTPYPVSATSYNLCNGATTTFNDASTGGTWSSTNTTAATISTGGVVTGVGTGTSTISYSVASGCASFKNITVIPVPASITGVAVGCTGQSTQFSDLTPGGIWSSSNTGAASVGSTGIVSGVTASSVATISYSLTGCSSIFTVSVYASPYAIGGVNSICIGSTSAFADATTGGSWSSVNPSVATITGGVLSGVSAGTSIISYSATSGCATTKAVTVNPIPATITGVPGLCAGNSSTLYDSSPGGVWTSSNTSSATINSSTGSILGVTAASVATISYSLGGCYTTKSVSVYTTPNAITGSASICVGASATLAESVTGGVWISSNASVATIGSVTPLITGVSAGTALISYVLSTGCYVTKVISVNASPSAVSGVSTICSGIGYPFTDGTPGGAWSSSNASAATVSTAGIVSGINAGVSNISYSLSGCYSYYTVTVVTSPSPIAGASGVCLGSTTTFADGTSGGTWSSNNSSTASVGSLTGAVSGVSAGTAIITYANGAGCFTTTAITVVNTPAAVSGTGTLCVGNSVTFTDATPGGSWSSSNTSSASVGASTGMVTGVSPSSSANIYYTVSGCSSSYTVSVNALPYTMSGVSTMCAGATAGFSDGSAGGTWSSLNTGVATISGSGVVSSVAAGTTVISYTLTSGCYVTKPLTVTPSPSGITGPDSLCAGVSNTFTNATPGGVWSSSNSSAATVVSGSGLVTGVSAGASNITYSVSGCIISKVVSVNATPAAISSYTLQCTGMSSTFTDAISGGSWTSTNTSIFTVGSATGIVIGVSAGTAEISYTLPTGCAIAKAVNVNTSPDPIVGIGTQCTGDSTFFTDGTSGGTWTSNDLSAAIINPSTGVLTAVQPGITGPGVAIITYSVGTGCYSTFTASVFASPYFIPQGSHQCTAQSTLYTDAISGGVWSSTNPSVVTVGSNTGVVTGVVAGTAVISYTIYPGCAATKAVNVFTSPGAVTGTSSICTGASLTFTNPTSGGVWTSSNIYAASVGSGSGVVTGLLYGITYIMYTVPNGCVDSEYVFVNVSPYTIAGGTSLCPGVSGSLSDYTTGGTWTSSNTSVVSVGTTGVVTGVSNGTAMITYTVASGCNSIVTVTVGVASSGISGPNPICQGATQLFTDATSGGTWYSGNTSVATVVSSTGYVTGVGAGTVPISYVIPSGCTTVTNVTVNPTPAAISGAGNICVGNSTTYTNSVSGGVWSSTSPGVASINSATGVISGVAPGTATISYTLTCGAVSKVITINPLPSGVGGNSNVCIGFSTTLTDAGGGTWISSNTSVATIVSGTGVETGVSTGTAIITYTLPTGCIGTFNTVVNPLPGGISGTAVACLGSTDTLSDAGSGTWTSGSTSIATVGSANGVVTGVLAGTTFITYTLPTGCYSTDLFVVDPAPSAISGSNMVCIGSSITLSDGGSGTWSSSNTSVATVGATGIVSGASAGTTIITYSIGTGCIVSTTITVNSLPAGITGSMQVCPGLSVTLSDATGVGTWSTSNGAVATVVSGTGVVTGVSAGTAEITYTVTGTGCIAAAQFTVNPSPASITGASQVCTGLSITLTDATGGGTWGSSASGVASVSGGVVTGVASGSATITYTALGCIATKQVIVNPLPGNISGSSQVCNGLSTTLSDATGAGTWSSSNGAVATVVSGTGVVTGVSAGTDEITYTITATGCLTATQVTVNALPANITGTTNFCNGLSATLADATGAGTWSSSNGAVATVVSGTGVVTSVSAGTDEITYTITATGCLTATQVTVNPLPANITGTTNFCNGLSTTLSDATGAGTWSSSNGAVATVVSGTGVVTSVSAGTDEITYTITATGCLTATLITVNPLPANIGGTTNVCAGNATTLTDATGSGTWSTSNGAVATVVSGTGVVSGVSAGTDEITYTITATGCLTAVQVTVNPVPAGILGTTQVCIGASSTLTDATGTGTWGTSDGTVATVVSATGVVSGVGAGSATITYTVSGTGCYNTTNYVVNPLPSAISGSNVVCVGSSITLTDPGSGTWNSSNTAVATIDPSSGMVTGVGAGTFAVTYTLSTGCYTSETLTVSVTPASVSASTSNLCSGVSYTFTDASSSGVWVSSNTAAATVGSNSGIVSAVAAGTSTISYDVSGCVSSVTVSVNASPVAITGPASFCDFATANYTDGTSGGTWSSSNTGVATMSSNTATGVSVGSTTISYITGSGCSSTLTVNVTTAPVAITGPFVQCTSQSTQLSDATGGGNWSSNTAHATVNSSGVVSGVSAGTATISYILSGCYSVMTVTVSASPNAITGTMAVCSNLSTTLSDATGSGTWSSTNTGIATINSSGVASGVSAGTVVISYAIASGCAVTTTVAFNQAPSVISGPNLICQNQLSQFTNVYSGGTWSSSNVAAGTIQSATGLGGGVASGNNETIITYNISGCTATKTVSENTTPGTISAGTTLLCLGNSVTYTDPTGGGAWVSYNTSVATVGSSTGIVSGVGIGTSLISYALSSGCATSVVVTVNPTPDAITGPTTVCNGQTSQFNDAESGGVWVSSNTSTATIGSLSGLAIGTLTSGSGTTNIEYFVSGCPATFTVTGGNFINSISGNANLCTGTEVTYTDATTGGTWSSTNPAVGTIGTDGTNAIGVSAGTTTISYTMPSGCASFLTVPSLIGPDPIVATNYYICSPLTYQFTDATSGGTWTSSNTLGATVGATTGVVTPLALSIPVITYTIANGCFSAVSVYVDRGGETLHALTGTSSLCTGTSVTLSDVTSSGTWSTQNSSVATVSGGNVSGVAAGTSAITYALTYCYTTDVVTVVSPPDPGTISYPCSGCNTVSVAGTLDLTETVSGGTWTSSATGKATINTSGVVTGVANGTATISYAITNVCTSYATATVVVGTGGPRHTNNETIPLCLGSSVLLSGGNVTGTWSSSNNAIANVNPETGEVTGIGIGQASVTFTIPEGLETVAEVYNIIVNPLPDAVVITANPGVVLQAGQTVTFTAKVSNGGTMPVYTWLVNGIAVPGATLSTFTSNNLSNNDVVSCNVGSGSGCGDYTISNSTVVSIVNENNHLSSGTADLRVLPNPNKGSFVITGSLGVVTDEDVSITITDMLGQVLYTGKVIAKNGNINQPINLGGSTANGMYLLTVHTDQQNDEFHFVVEQ